MLLRESFHIRLRACSTKDRILGDGREMSLKSLDLLKVPCGLSIAFCPQAGDLLLVGIRWRIA